MVSEDHENRIVAAAGLQTAAHVEEITSAAIFRPSQDPWNDGVGRDDKRASVGIVIYKIEYCLVRNNGIALEGMRSGNQIGNGRSRSGERDHDHGDRPLNAALLQLAIEKHRYQRGNHRCQIQK